MTELEHSTWDRILEHAQACEDYPQELRRRILDSVQVLRAELGELDNGGRGSDYRLWRVQINQAPWTRYWLAWLADCLSIMKSLPSYRMLHRRLRVPSRFSEALDVIEVADVCLAAGLNVEFDPSVIIASKDRMPDLLVGSRDGTEILFIEVTTLHDPKAMREASRISMIAAPQMMKPPLRLAGRCTRRLTPDTLPHLLQLADQVAEQAMREGTMRSAHLPDVAELAYAPEEQLDRLEAWTKARGMERICFEWPEYETKEAARVTSCLREKVRQLPPASPGVIVICNPRLRGGEPPSSDDLGDRTDIRDELQRFPHVICCVLCSGTWAVSPPTLTGAVRPSWSSVASRMPFELWRFDYEFIWNPEYELARPRVIVRRLYRDLYQIPRREERA
jgi:hypothetical protein